MGIKQVALIGGGGHALVVADAAISGGASIKGYFDDSMESPLGRLMSLARLGSIFGNVMVAGDDDKAEHEGYVLCIGDIGVRRRVINAWPQLAKSPVSIFHPRAVLSESATLGAGTFIGANAVVQPWAMIGEHCIINTGAIVEHECVLGSNVHVAPGAVIAGNVTIGSDTLIGVGARVLPGVTIGLGCTVGAGAVVVANVRDGVTVKGMPARQ